MRTYIRTGNKGEKVLSYDENFKKWQKSGESKTPGGVKIGIFRFVAVLLFGCTGLTFNYSAWGASCSNCSADNPVAGCYYSNSGCRECSQQHYCDDQTNEEKSCSSYAGADYPYSASGAKSKYECYKKLAGQTGNGYGSTCQNSTGTDITYSDIDNTAKCRQYYRESGTFVSCNGDTGTDDNGDVNNSATSDYHIEGTGDNAKCYSNTRNCNLFDKKYKATDRNYAKGLTEAITNTVCEHEECSMGRTVRGDATWDGNEWDVSDCYAERNADDIIVKYNNNHEQNAYCSGVILSKQENSSDSVNNVNVAISYNYGNFYLCTKCNAGYAVANGEYTEGSDAQIACYYATGHNYSGSSSVYVCKCAPVDPGYYLSSQVQICSYNSSQSYSFCKKPVSQLNNLIEPSNKQPCGPGQTTDLVGGATSEADCHYTTQTRFCDARGCFYLSGLSWDATNGYTWGGATSTGQ